MYFLKRIQNKMRRGRETEEREEGGREVLREGEKQTGREREPFKDQMFSHSYFQQGKSETE